MNLFLRNGFENTPALFYNFVDICEQIRVTLVSWRQNISSALFEYAIYQHANANRSLTRYFREKAS